MASVGATVGQLPFNFEIGASLQDVVVIPPVTEAGELNVHLGSCEGPLLAQLPLQSALDEHATTRLSPVAIDGDDLPSKADLCFRFGRHGVDPIWAVGEIRLHRASPQ